MTALRLILIFRNGVAESSSGCVRVEGQYGSWDLCLQRQEAVLHVRLSEAELPIDAAAYTVHPNAALMLLLDTARAVLDEADWRPGGALRIAVVGPPGSGKSTLVSRLLGLPQPSGPTAVPGVYAAVVLGREAEILDMPGGAPAPDGADCTVAVAPLDVYEEVPPVRGRAVLVGSRADLGGGRMLELYRAALRPAAAHALDLRKAPRWALAKAIADCV
jgi:hypothetical protein